MRDLFLKDWGWKLFSLLLAAGIWFTVHHILFEANSPSSDAAASPVTYGNLPVFIVSTAEDVHLYHVKPDTVSVTVSGSPDTIAVLQANQIRATVDLTSIESAKELSRRVEVSVPSGVALISVKPQNVSVIVPPPPEKKP
jgi:YbbR domain-containing protein